MSGPKKPSIKTINAGLGRWLHKIGKTAKEVREKLDLAYDGRWPSIDDALGGANEVLEGHGIEALREEGDYDGVAALYVNMGDTYTPTILYDTERRAFLVTDWGSWVEAAERRGMKF